MGARLKSFALATIAVFAFVAIVFFHANSEKDNGRPESNALSSLPTSASQVAQVASSKNSASTSSTSAIIKSKEAPLAKGTKNPTLEPQSNVPPQTLVTRLESPYTFGTRSFDEINVSTRAALVNILCMPRSGGTFRPTSGSGVLIDPRGVILTNAHVAQYVLLASDQRVNLSCIIRGKSPASPMWNAEVLYIPSIWVNDHAQDLNAERAKSTGEHDYALLHITSNVDDSPTASPVSFLPVESREKITFPGDSVLVAAYPAEFVGGAIATNNLYSVSSVTTIKQLLTFETGAVDLFSVGGVLEAQSGSSGGAVVNAWNYLVGIVTTTSDGATTAERDLHVTTLDYINRDIKVQTGKSLGEFLSGDLAVTAAIFNTQEAPDLIDKFISKITPGNN